MSKLKISKKMQKTLLKLELLSILLFLRWVLARHLWILFFPVLAHAAESFTNTAPLTSEIHLLFESKQIKSEGFGFVKGPRAQVTDLVQVFGCNPYCGFKVYYNGDRVYGTLNQMIDLEIEYNELRREFDFSDEVIDNFPLKGPIAICSIGGPAIGTALNVFYEKFGIANSKIIYTQADNCKFLRQIKPKSLSAQKAAQKIQNILDDIVRDL